MQSSEENRRDVRLARNQAIFRVVNEKLRELNEAFEPVTGTFAIACECADLNCFKTLEITPDEYAAVRRDPRRFIVLPGRIYPDVERVAGASDGHVIVEKLGQSGETAEAAS